MYNRFVCIIFLMFIGNMVVAQKNGAIKGKVVEYRTKQPLTGATIAIPEKDFVAVTYSSGIFIISNLSAGTLQRNNHQYWFL